MPSDTALETTIRSVGSGGGGGGVVILVGVLVGVGSDHHGVEGKVGIEGVDAGAIGRAVAHGEVRREFVEHLGVGEWHGGVGLVGAARVVGASGGGRRRHGGALLGVGGIGEEV